MYTGAKYLMAGDRAVTVEFGNEISPEINRKVRAMAVSAENLGLWINTIPTYRSLTIEYDPKQIQLSELLNKLKSIESGLSEVDLPSANIFEIPVLYGGVEGPDLDFVSKHNNLTGEEVAKIHSSANYLIYMLGFTPGFPYLGGMDKSIAAPRLNSPRTKIPVGSVGIAGEQTGVYSVESPGGWQLIGKTPIKLYDPLREPPIFYKSGDYVKFVPINKAEYLEIEKAVSQNRFDYKYYPEKEVAHE